MLKTICYRSSITNEPSILEIETLFDACKKNNDKYNIKGLLYKYEGYYFQIIEGETETIDAIFSCIKTDKRHKNIDVLVDIPITEYTFDNFTTGYNKVNDLNTLFGLQEYHDLIVTNNFASKDIFSEIISNLFSLEA